MNYSGKLSLQADIYMFVKQAIENLKEGECINFLTLESSNEILDSIHDVKKAVENRDESQELEDLYYDLPFGYFHDNHGFASEYKIIGFRQNDNKDSIGDVILHSTEETEEFKVLEKSNVNISLEIMADITDML